ncbi:hypothetical protein [Bradyrhizobium japonicum]|uniref:hypothetical protein n=1 Tax=Bradyrhizobium japonicum TaxID=375 RepID=UPI001B8A4751|nr:hypothetical protein [Bradyrhizobium japonicum]MBR0969141.1 hypothetical protein [Bradyrhizobium japonicum]
MSRRLLKLHRASGPAKSNPFMIAEDISSGNLSAGDGVTLNLFFCRRRIETRLLLKV